MSLALLIGDRQCGKTSTCRRLVELARGRGHAVAGLIAPAVYQAGNLTGYDVVDLATHDSTRLASTDAIGTEHVGRFRFLDEGLAFGRAALQHATNPDHGIVIVDEVGPLELSGGGWHNYLAPLAKRDGLTLFTVRRSLTDKIARFWEVAPDHRFDLNDGADEIVERLIQLVES